MLNTNALQRKNFDQILDEEEVHHQDKSRTLNSVYSTTPIQGGVTYTPTIPTSTMNDFRKSTQNDIEYRDLKQNLNKVSPGGRGGPGPDKMCNTARRQRWLFEQSQREITGLETSEYNMTPFVN